MADEKCSNYEYGPLIASIDEGTSSVRFMVFASNTGEVVAYHQLPLKSSYPFAEWVEQDPIEILKIVIECIDETTKKLEAKGFCPSNIVAIGITNQRETTILWDKYTGLPLYKAIVWMDNRTSVTVSKLLSNKEDRSKDQLRELCGLPISPYFSALKYRWLIDNVPEITKAIQEKRCLFGTVDSWLIWNLTGGVQNGIHITDVTNASRTMLMNINSLKWDTKLIEFFDLPADTLPEIRSSAEIYGYLSSTSLKNVPIAGCVGDQHAALIGQLCFKKGQTKCTYGTGCFILSNTGYEKIHSKHGLLTTVAYQLGKDAQPFYALEGSITIAGASLSWLKNNMKVVDDLENVNKLAEEVSSSNDVYFVPAFQGLYAPYWDSNARGLICGLTMETDRRHIIRAAIEAVCYQTKDVLDAIKQDCGLELTQLKVDGGMVKNNLMLQFQADISGIDIVRQDFLESTAYGAAIAAGMAKGIEVWNLTEIKQDRIVFTPKIMETERHKKYSKWKTAVMKYVFTKPLEDFQEKTLYGGLVTILCWITIFYLTFRECCDYLKTSWKEEIFVDVSGGSKLLINLDIIVSEISCDYLALDAVDSSGDQHLHIDYNIYKRRLDLNGNPIEPPQKENIRPINKTTIVTKQNSSGDCGSCYGAGEIDQCCNTCLEVKEAYSKKNWQFKPERFVQCLGEANSNASVFQEGCQLYGTMEVNRVGGSFHIAPGQSFSISHIHVHDVQPYSSQMFNTTHHIRHLSFGKKIMHLNNIQINPLDGYIGHAKEGVGSSVVGHKQEKLVFPLTYLKLMDLLRF
ncbi:hypothetical protein PGB90_007074 [Kerria lacca]